jgi:hypothetical protein
MTLLPMLVFSVRHAGALVASMMARRNRNQLLRQLLGRTRRAVPASRVPSWR